MLSIRVVVLYVTLAGKEITGIRRLTLFWYGFCIADAPCRDYKGIG